MSKTSSSAMKHITGKKYIQARGSINNINNKNNDITITIIKVLIVTTLILFLFVCLLLFCNDVLIDRYNAAKSLRTNSDSNNSDSDLLYREPTEDEILAEMEAIDNGELAIKVHPDGTPINSNSEKSSHKNSERKKKKSNGSKSNNDRSNNNINNMNMKEGKEGEEKGEEEFEFGFMHYLPDSRRIKQKNNNYREKGIDKSERPKVLKKDAPEKKRMRI